jgi:hypothetical protein
MFTVQDRSAVPSTVIAERAVLSAIEFLNCLDSEHYATVCRLALDEFRDIRHPDSEWCPFANLLAQHEIDRNRKEHLLILGSQANKRAHECERAAIEASRTRLAALGCLPHWER